MKSQELYEKYFEKFDDYPPTMEMRGLDGAEMDKKIEEAIKDNEPIEFEHDEEVDY